MDNIKQGSCSPFRVLAVSIFGMLILLLSPGAIAGELNLLVNGHAQHLKTQPGVNYNERNWGAGLQYDYEQRDNGWVPFLTGSGFKDSMNHMSYYAGGGAQYRFDVAPSLDGLHVDAGVVAFLMTRKDFKGDHPFPGVLPAFTIGTKHVSLNITYIPKVEPKMVPLWFFQLKVPLMNL